MENAIARDYADLTVAGIKLTSAGRSDTMPNHQYGPAVRPYYLIHYIIAGAGTFTVNHVDYQLHAGQGFLITPNCRTTYTADATTPWSYVWLGFTGQEATGLITHLGVSPATPVFASSHSYELVNCVNQILMLDETTAAKRLQTMGYLFQFLSYIAAGTVNLPQHGGGTQSHYVTQAIQHIRTHLTTVSVDELAQAVSVNRSYLTDLFKQELDLTPSEYIRNFRITNARHLLESTNLPIDQVAANCGYVRTNSFTRLFKRAYGISPRQYRQQSRTKGEQLRP